MSDIPGTTQATCGSVVEDICCSKALQSLVTCLPVTQFQFARGKLLSAPSAMCLCGASSRPAPGGGRCIRPASERTPFSWTSDRPKRQGETVALAGRYSFTHVPIELEPKPK